jgi:hypothetical protein
MLEPLAMEKLADFPRLAPFFIKIVDDAEPSYGTVVSTNLEK